MARILVVDDEPMVARCVQRTLARAGHEVDVSHEPGNALRMFGEASYDVAIVDFQLPGMDGLEVLTQMRAKRPGCLRMMMTGQLDLPLAVEAVNGGEVAKVIEKPFDPGQLVARVDEALEGRKRVIEVCLRRAEAAEDDQRRMLEDCFRDGHLRLALQPIVRATDWQVVAFEGLLRSSHPVLDGPLAVLRAAEHHGMVPRVADTVVALAVDWLGRLPPEIVLFINLHPDELADPPGLARRLAALRPHAHRVVMEITERSRLDAIPSWWSSIGYIADAGISLALDDLGAGYNSLSVLAALNARYVKVDMSIVRGVDREPRKQRLVDLTCRFADATGADLIAEGVETVGEARALRGCGVHMMQGYLFGRPNLDLPEDLAELARRTMQDQGILPWRLGSSAPAAQAKVARFATG